MILFQAITIAYTKSNCWNEEQFPIQKDTANKLYYIQVNTFSVYDIILVPIHEDNIVY